MGCINYRCLQMHTTILCFNFFLRLIAKLLESKMNWVSHHCTQSVICPSGWLNGSNYERTKEETGIVPIASAELRAAINELASSNLKLSQDLRYLADRTGVKLPELLWDWEDFNVEDWDEGAMESFNKRSPSCCSPNGYYTLTNQQLVHLSLLSIIKGTCLEEIFDIFSVIQPSRST
jgi:hypothetical protein